MQKRLDDIAGLFTAVAQLGVGMCKEIRQGIKRKVEAFGQEHFVQREEFEVLREIVLKQASDKAAKNEKPSKTEKSPSKKTKKNL